jgi:multicomponent Na+:H+ antiporter subunit D
MSLQLPALIIVAPLIGSFFIAAAGLWNARLCLPIAVFSLGAALASSIAMLSRVMAEGLLVYRLGGWDPPWGIAINIDYLNGLVLPVVAAVAFVNLFGSHAMVRRDFADRLGPFYTLYVLFVTGLLGIVATGDAFNLYVLLEIASLTGYALLGMGHERAPLASLNYLFMGTIGASFYLLGVGYLYLITGTLNMADIAARLPDLFASRVVLFAFGICMMGLFLKMALFPFHAWLPNAYSFSPNAAASLIAPLTTKVMIYVMVRVALYVFTPSFSFQALDIHRGFVWLAVAAIVMGSLFALAQRSLKRMLTYILIAEVGYMVGGFWLGNRAGVTGAILHIFNDALMTLCVFLAAGSLAYRLKGDAFEDLQGVFRKMPFTMVAMVAAALAIIGVPPTCGFFSKWYLIQGGLAAGQYGFVTALLFSSLVNVVLFFRIFEIGYYEPFADSPHDHGHGPAAVTMAEAPLGILVPLMIAAAGLILAGLYTGQIVSRIIDPAIPPGIL